MDYSSGFNTSQPVEMDLIKVSHHGSRNNTSPGLVEAVWSRINVISTDGTKHEHPHAEAMFRIVGSSSPQGDCTVNLCTE